jgi:hypothetical protein
MPARARADVVVVNDRQYDMAAARDMSPVFEAIRARRPSLL